MKKLHKKVKNLNQANAYLIDGIKLIKTNIHLSQDMETRVWQLEKALKNLNQEILKQLKKDNLENDFLQITKDF